jgi:hypothetical protein
LSQRRGQLALLIVGTLGSGGVAAWSLSGGHTIAGVAWAIAGIAWAFVAFDRFRRLRIAAGSAAGLPADNRIEPGVGARADAIDRVVAPGEAVRRWTVAADTSQGAVRRGALMLSDRALYCTFETGPSLQRRTARIPVGAITDISRLPSRRLGLRYRAPNGDTRSIVVDLPARDEATALVTALVEARRALSPGDAG